MFSEEFYNIYPRIQPLPEYDMKPDSIYHGIKAFFYDGADYKGKKTKVFAHIGFPEMKQGERVPAVVLVHGGGGHAFPEWIRLWNERGFAAIAMDTTGFVPREDKKGLLVTETATMPKDYVHELYGALSGQGYTCGPDNSRMLDCDLPHDEQWMYHAIADTILAHNILRRDERIDREKIGIAGISWGGVITSLAIGYDNRYAFAVPIYGTGHLDALTTPKLPSIFRDPKVKSLWSAADRFDKVCYPVLWKNWVYDTAFSVVGANMSYKDTQKSGSMLSMSIEMGHSHIDAWKNEDGYRFAQGIVGGFLPLIKPCEQPKGRGDISFGIEIPSDFSEITASVYYLTAPIEYGEDNRLTQSWTALEARIENSTVYAFVPDDAVCYFVELKGTVNGKEYISDTEIIHPVGCPDSQTLPYLI